MFRPPAVPLLTLAQCAERAAGRAAPLKRRLAAFLYEGVLLFGVVMLVGMVFGMATQQRHALQGREGLQAMLFLALSLYFIWFWSHGGQTLAMKTWHVRLVRHDGLPPTLPPPILQTHGQTHALIECMQPDRRPPAGCMQCVKYHSQDYS